MKEFKRLNNIIGWAVFTIATFVYLFTMEKTASLWDCGEFIAGAYRLEVVHAPGAPLFLLLGRFFSLFTTDVNQVAIAVNAMSALCSSFTILFLFWTITAFGRKIYNVNGEIKWSKMRAILGAGIVGSLAYTFSDSFWFSAAEGEVYAMSSLFTAITFWCILKWEEEFETARANKWLILIAYLIGLSIGVHLLSLLTIPAIGMIYYFKKNEYTHWGAAKALIISSVILLFIQGLFIPKTAALLGWFDKFFVNSFGMPFNSGIILFIILLTALIIYGLKYTRENNKPMWNTAILSVTFLLIGYSSYATVLIRSNAETPINIGAPDDAMKLSRYLQREQYGEWPVLRGQHYNDEIKRDESGRAITIPSKEIWEKNEESGKYEKVATRYEYEYKEKPSFFPRMYSPSRSPNPDHVGGYQLWVPDHVTTDEFGRKVPNVTLNDDLKFFVKYQINWSYLRYFMWNFAGRQNDVMNMDGNSIFGNWESGLSFNKYKDAPKYLKENKAKNHYYFLPLLIGLLGLFFHFKSKKTDAISVLLFFLFTGLFIIVYLNVPPYQPRERDYAYVGSFYAFAIWIGIGVLGLYDLLKNKINGKQAALASTTICLIAAPVLMAVQNWDDHNRSGRTIALDVGKNYLGSCEKNGILFTNGDNDTYPLWYCQEVEGIRTDVKNVNMSLLGMNYYIEQTKRKTYKADGVPSTLDSDFYKGDQMNGVSVWQMIREDVGGKKKIIEMPGRVSLNSGTISSALEKSLKGIKNGTIKEVSVTAETAIRILKESSNRSKKNKSNFTWIPRKIIIPIDEEKILNDPRWLENKYLNRKLEEDSNWFKNQLQTHMAWHQSEDGKWSNKKIYGILIEIGRPINILRQDPNNPRRITNVDRENLMQNQIALIDILCNFNWERPLHFVNHSQTFGKIRGVDSYIQQEGTVTQLVPFKVNNQQINFEKTYNLVMNQYRYGNLTDPNVYFDYYSERSIAQFQQPFAVLANSVFSRFQKKKGDLNLILKDSTSEIDSIRENYLLKKNSVEIMKDSTIEIVDAYFNKLPQNTNFSGATVYMITLYMRLGAEERYDKVIEYLNENIKQRDYLSNIEDIKGDARSLFMHTLNNITQVYETYTQEILQKDGDKFIDSETLRSDIEKSLNDMTSLIQGTLSNIEQLQELLNNKQLRNAQQINKKQVQQELQRIQNNSAEYRSYNVLSSLKNQITTIIDNEIAAKNREINQIDNLEKIQDLSVNSDTVKLNSGLMIKSIFDGDGKEFPQFNDKVSVHYTGYLTDGTKFDSSLDRNTPFEVTIGAGQVIAGWEEALSLMKKGDKWRITIPSELGYGENGFPPKIPKNATLIFEMELLEIIKPDQKQQILIN